MPIIEVNIAGFQFTHGAPRSRSESVPAGKRRGWHVAGVDVRPVAWRGGLLRRPRAA